MTQEARKNAYRYCQFRDTQFALYDAYAKRHGLSLKTLLVVNVLYYAPEGMTQAEICRRTLQSKQTVNQIVRHLLDSAHATTAEVPSDKRNKTIRMTPAGRACYGAVVRHITWAEDTAMSLLSAEEQQQLIALSRTFTHHLTRLVQQEREEAEE